VDSAASWIVVKTLLGLLALVVAAYFGGHPKVRHLATQLGISGVIAAGLPFLLLGVVARHESVGVLTDSTLDHLRPVLHLGLGWIGLVVGMRVRLSEMTALPRETSTILGIGTGLPFAALVGLGVLILGIGRWASGAPLLELELVRDAALLGTAGAVAADTELLRRFARHATDDVRRGL
jgi:hypothetical protein